MMCLKHIRLSLPGTNSLGQAYVCSFFQPTVSVYMVQLYWVSMASGNLREKEFYLLNSYTLFSCILRKIIISTGPWEPGRKNRKDCPILELLYIK